MYEKLMKLEIDIGISFLKAYIERFGCLEAEKLEEFSNGLAKNLLNRYTGHWHTENPLKGQAYRSLDFHVENRLCDKTICALCANLNIDLSSLGFRDHFTLWIDPFEVSIRFGSPISPKDHECFTVAKFDHQGNLQFKQDLEKVLSATRLPFAKYVRRSPINRSLQSSPKPAVVNNAPALTSAGSLSPQAPEFRYRSPQIENNTDSSDETSSVDENSNQPERSDTPNSMHSVTSNESTDSGYCGYVESYPYYYRLNRLNRALALQQQKMAKPFQKHRPPRSNQPRLPFRPESPPTPTAANINMWARLYGQNSHVPMPAVPNAY